MDRQQLTYAKVDLAAGATLTLSPDDAGQQVRLVHMYSTMTAAGTVKFQSGATDLTGDMTFGAGAGPCFRSTPEDPFLRTIVAGDDLTITPTTGGLDGFVAYYCEGA